MSVSTTAPTDQVPPCLRLTVYHPGDAAAGIFRHFPRGRAQHASHTALTVGRSDACHLRLHFQQASRAQLQIDAVRRRRPAAPDQTPELDDELSFEVKNLSRTTELRVDGRSAGHLERVALPPRSLMQFGQFQVCCEVEAGESVDSFEVLCEVAAVPLRQESGGIYGGSRVCVPTMETGGGGGGDDGFSVAGDSGSYGSAASAGESGVGGGVCGGHAGGCASSVPSDAAVRRRIPTES